MNQENIADFGTAYPKEENERKTPENLKPYYKLSVSVTFKVLDEDIDDIMCTALEGGITYWCNRTEIVGDKYLGEASLAFMTVNLMPYIPLPWISSCEVLPHTSADAMTLQLMVDELIPVRLMLKVQTALFSMQSLMTLSTDNLQCIRNCGDGIGRRLKKGQQQGHKSLPRETELSGGSGRVRRGCGVSYVIRGAKPLPQDDFMKGNKYAKTRTIRC